VWEQRKSDFDLDVVEGGRARGSFAPYKRESVSTLIKNPPPGAPAPPIMPPLDGTVSEPAWKPKPAGSNPLGWKTR
jgi:hypothetical protein